MARRPMPSRLRRRQTAEQLHYFRHLRCCSDHEGRRREGPRQQGREDHAPGALVGAVVGILLPPLLVADVALGALAGHLWGGMSRADMRDLGELLDEGEVALVVVAEVEREGSLTKEFKRASRMMHRYVGTGAARIREALDGREPEHVTR